MVADMGAFLGCRGADELVRIFDPNVCNFFWTILLKDAAFYIQSAPAKLV